jgi:phenylalanyl-tRNA synthetase beta chain
VFELGRVFVKDATVADGPLAIARMHQPNRVGGLAYGLAWDEQWGVAKREVDFFDAKGDVERIVRRDDVRFIAAEHPAFHPGRSARIEFDGRGDGRMLGWIGELHPRWQQKYELPKAPILFEVDVEPLLPVPLPRFEVVPRFPAVLRDVAMWVDAAVPLQRIYDEVARVARTDERLRALREFRLFDLYRPGAEDSSKFAGASANALLNKEKSLAFRIVLQDTDRTLSDVDADAAVAAIVEGLGAQIGARLRQ